MPDFEPAETIRATLLRNAEMIDCNLRESGELTCEVETYTDGESEFHEFTADSYYINSEIQAEGGQAPGTPDEPDVVGTAVDGVLMDDVDCVIQHNQDSSGVHRIVQCDHRDYSGVVRGVPEAI